MDAKHSHLKKMFFFSSLASSAITLNTNKSFDVKIFYNKRIAMAAVKSKSKLNENENICKLLQ